MPRRPHLASYYSRPSPKLLVKSGKVVSPAGLRGFNNYQSAGAEGQVLFMLYSSGATDPYTNSPTTAQQAWLRAHWDYAMVFGGYFQSRLSWFPKAVAYIDSYAIYYNGGNPVHPEFILKDNADNTTRLWIPFQCSGGVCTQYAADVGDPSFRSYMISQYQNVVQTQGFFGVCLDDVNLDSLHVSNGSGVATTPRDPRTGTGMTTQNWRRYFAEYMEAVAAGLPLGTMIIHNSIWYADPSHDAVPGVCDPYIIRQIQASTVIEVEHAFNDTGLGGGTGQWSIYQMMKYCDSVHALGKSLWFNATGGASTVEAEYNLGCYFLVSNGSDMIFGYGWQPDYSSIGGVNNGWWPGYDVDLGSALGARYAWNGVTRRDFTGGIVLMNDPGATTKTLTPGGTFQTVTGASVTSVTLAARQAAVLRY